MKADKAVLKTPNHYIIKNKVRSARHRSYMLIKLLHIVLNIVGFVRAHFREKSGL